MEIVMVGKESKILLELLQSAITGSRTDVPNSDSSYSEVYNLSRFHNVDGTAFYGINNNNVILSDNLYKEWSRAKDRNIAKTTIENQEKAVIFKTFEEHHIFFLPLKGLIIKQMYPRPELRQMADLDILVHEFDIDLAGKLLVSNGYKMRHSREGHHILFFKPPYMTIELHYEMIGKDHASYYKYYEDIWNKVLTVDGKVYEHKLTWNDFYIFMLVHFAKHYYGGGSGIRSIMDVYVFLDKHASDLDEKYLNRELEKLKLTNFRSDVETLAHVWFGKGNSNMILDSNMPEYIMTSGAYGTLAHIKEKRIADSTTNGKLNKFQYIRRRLFPNIHFMSYYYPSLIKRPYLLPWFWLHRIITKGKKGICELKDIGRD